MADVFKSIAQDLQFVFVASCHSEKIATIFHKMGVPHVICIEQSMRMNDKAAIEFSKLFYDEVFDQFKSLCDAFECAKARVEKNFGKFEANKLRLLKHHEGPCNQFSDERLRPTTGVIKRVGDQKRLLKVPNRISTFTLKSRDIYEVL